MTGVGGREGEKTQDDCSLVRAAIWKWGRGNGLKEKEEDGVRTSQGRSADQAEKKREKKKRNRAIHLRYENKSMLFVCVMA